MVNRIDREKCDYPPQHQAARICGCPLRGFEIGEAGCSVYRSVSRRYTAEKALLYVIFRRIIKPIRKRAAASHPLLFRWQLGSSIIQSRQVR
jgi:hypothetical protein